MDVTIAFCIGLLVGFLIARHSLVMREITDLQEIVSDAGKRVSRLTDIIQEWQKKI